jgi:hypothetical protein
VAGHEPADTSAQGETGEPTILQTRLEASTYMCILHIVLVLDRRGEDGH